MSDEVTFKLNLPETKQVGDINLVLKPFKSLGHLIRYYVAATSADFNKLDPKRPDACCEEATNNIVYRSMHPDLRQWFLHGREAMDAKDSQPAVSAIKGVEEEVMSWELPIPTMANGQPFLYLDKTPVDSWSRATKVAKNTKGEVRMKDGEQVEVFDASRDTEDSYYNRVIAMSVAAKKFASEDAARDHWQQLAETIALEVPFDVEARERVSRLPAKLPTKDKVTAAVIITRGTVERFLTTNMNQVREGVTWTATNDASKMYAGTAVVKGVEVQYNVSDKDAESLGKLVREYREWKADQEREVLAA